MDLGLKGKRALILSSSRGLGRGIAESLAAEGADVFLTARNADRLKEAADTINARGQGRALFLATSLTGHAEDIYKAAVDALGHIDILIANTGGPPPRTALNVEIEQWQPNFEAMVLPVITLAGLVLPGMQQRKFGRIVTIASTGVRQPIPTLVLSNTLRSSLVAWSKTLATAVAKDGITVNVALPGRIHTDRVDELDAENARAQGKTVEEIVAEVRAGVPSGRYGRVEEFADVVCFLASERASYVTGSTIAIDGGLIRGL